MKREAKKRLIIAFGSQVSGKTHSDSDFDFAVLKEKHMTLSDHVKISEYLARRFGINEDKIDLIDLNTASPLLMYEVAQKGKLVEGGDFDFTRFKIRAWKTYLDTAKFRRLGEQMIKRYAERIRLEKA